MKHSEDLKVFISSRDSSCEECGESLGRGAWITLVEDKGALCLSCADLDHLIFLPRGNAALTRRASKHSTLRAVVVEFSRSRNRYERQGILVDERALEQAERECLEDAEARALRRKREARRRDRLDAKYMSDFAEQIAASFPGCPQAERQAIAEHACRRHSGRG